MSDIKKESIDWQKKHFGFQTVISENKVEHFNPSVKFDVVFVGSLFTHLPEMLFKEWLEKLMNLLTTNGTLIISTFDINVHGKEYDSSFKYLEMSEDRLFNSLNSSIKGENKYGITYTTPKYIYDQLHQLNVKEDQIERYPLAFGKIQDIYIIHNHKVKLSPIDFSSYP